MIRGKNLYEYSKRIVKQVILPTVNTTNESYKFRHITQNDGEEFQAFVNRLRIQAKKCDFADEDRQIKDQIVIGCSSDKLRKVALREGPDLNRLITLGKSEESAEQCSAKMSIKEEANYTGHFGKNKPQSSSMNKKTQTCRNCGGNFPHTGAPCPAKNQKCYNCNRHGHFGSVCRSGRRKTASNQRQDAREIDHQSTSIPSGTPSPEPNADPESELAQAMSSLNYAFKTDVCHEYPEQTMGFNNENTNKQQQVKFVNNANNSIAISIDNVCPILFVADTGASVTIIDYESYLKLIQVRHYPLCKSNVKIYPYGATEPIAIKGYFNAVLEHDGNRAIVHIFVLRKHKCGNLLSKDACVKLKLLKLNYNSTTNSGVHNTESIKQVSNESTADIREEDMNPDIEKILSQFPTGIGLLKDFRLKLQIDDKIKPVAQRLRKTPISQRSIVDDKIDDLLANDAIEHATGPTSWLSPIHIVQKDGKDRLTVDMRVANTAIKRVRRPIPSVEEVMLDLNGAKYFSKIDLNAAYHQILLDEDSRNITTFSTHRGTFRYKRLFFGVCSASEEFQHIISQVLHDIPGATNIADDILVYGKTKEEHDEALKKTLQRLFDRGFTINRDKCKFGAPKVEFFGHEVSAEGMRPLIKESLLQIQRPTTKAEVRSYIGAVNFIGRYIPNFSSTLAPITNLLSQKSDFIWGKEQEEAFQKILKEIYNPRTLKHFDPCKPSELTTDASPVGLGAVLTQEGHPVTFISRKLTPVETRYSQTEREGLAVVWACERLHYYLYGINFKLLSDHKPLLQLYSPTRKPCARILRWALRLLPYKFQIQHIPGIENPADYFSRKPVCEAEAYDETDCADTEGYVNSVIMDSSPNSISLQEIMSESLKDEELSELCKRIDDSKWYLSPKLKSYLPVRGELMSKNGIILKDHKTVLPKSLRARALLLAHSSHLGMQKMKQFLRGKVWWPGMDRNIEFMVKRCQICQAANPEGKERLEPLRIKPTPERPFSTVHIDLFGPLDNGMMILAIVDELSRWPEVYMLQRTQSKDVINALNDTFGRFGNPDEVTSDNGPQFTSWEFKNYLSQEGIRQHLITPYYPQANSTVERFFRVLKKFVRVCNITKEDLKSKLYNFLKMYRNTPSVLQGSLLQK